MRAWGVRQLLTGLVALPLSALPFVGYMNLTPEGRLVRDRALVALWPPSLPTLTAGQVAKAAAAAPRYEGAVMALAYHGIGSSSDGEGGFVISAERFAEHLATLKAAGMNTVTAAQVADSFTGGAPLPPNAVMLSFDDGRTDAMLFADPLLKEAGMSATMFVITGAAAKPGIYYASWDKLESYAGSGRWDLQAHTAELHREHEADGGRRLPALTSLKPDESLTEYRARVREDLGKASAAIEEHARHRAVAFAYPFGAYGADRANDPAIRQILHEEVGRRYKVAFHQDEQESIPLLTGEQEDLLGLRRLEVEDWTGIQLLRHIDEAARRMAPPVLPTIGPDLLHGELGGLPTPAPGPAPTLPPDRPETRITVPRPAAPPTTAPRRVAVFPSTGAAPAPSPAPTATTPTFTSSPTTSPTFEATPTTSPTLEPTPTTSPTTSPPATTPTTTAPTTTTTSPHGCRSKGQGNICQGG